MHLFPVIHRSPRYNANLIKSDFLVEAGSVKMSAFFTKVPIMEIYYPELEAIHKKPLN